MAEQKEGRTFAEHLWDGFDKVYTRVTQGRHDLKRFKAYLEERAQVEEAYAKGLQKLSKFADFEVKSSLSKCWTEVRDTTKQVATQHHQLAETISKELGKQLAADIKEIKAEKTTMASTHQRLSKDVDKKTKQHSHCLQKYKDAVGAAERNILNRDGARKEKLEPKKLKEFDVKVDNSIKNVDSTHKNYSKAVKTLKQAQTNYDATLRKHLQKFQQLEEKRETHMKNHFQRFQQLHDFLKSSLDQISLLLNKGVGESDIAKDVSDFIAEHWTNKHPGLHVEYVPIDSEIINHARGGGTSAAVLGTASRVSAASVSRVSEPATTGGTGVKIAVALYDFTSDQAGDLSFKSGDHISVVEASGTDWWRGELNGKVGAFPANYVQLKEGGASAAAAPPSSGPMDAASVRALEAAGGGGKPRMIDGKCKALYDFDAQSGDELSFKTDDILYVTGELNDWFLGRTLDGTRVGIFPANYVQML